MKQYSRNITNSLILCLLVGILVCSGGVLQSQPCGTPQNCKSGVKYKYIFCKSDGTRYSKCTENPNAEPNPPVKNTLPLCVKYVGNHNPNDINPVPIAVTFFTPTPNPKSVQIWDATKAEQEVVQMLEEWNCICLPTNYQNNPNGSCCVKVGFTSNPDDFRNRGFDPQVTAGVASSAIDNGSCRIYCVNDGKADRIYLNNTDMWRTRGNLRGGDITQFFFNGDAMPSSNPDKIRIDFNKYRIVSFKQVVQHELGHWAGLEHNDDCTGGSDGVMNALTINNTRRTKLTQDDKCSFAKLYCPTIVGVNEHMADKNKSSGVSPNPSTDMVKITVSENCLHGDAELMLYDLLGNLVIKRSIDMGNESVEFDTSQLENGVFTYVIRSKGCSQSGRVVHVR